MGIEGNLPAIRVQPNGKEYHNLYVPDNFYRVVARFRNTWLQATGCQYLFQVHDYVRFKASNSTDLALDKNIVSGKARILQEDKIHFVAEYKTNTYYCIKVD